jgi:hypothetical protein
MTETTPQVFYEKLFSAMEVGHRKGESTLMEKMSKHFDLEGAADVLSELVRRVSPEDAMVWLLAEAAPFVQMLGEIYNSLSEEKATILGNADQLSLLFEGLDDRVSFPLDSFPKTYIRTLSDVDVLSTRFTPDARGYLMIDTPNYWRDDSPALRVLGYSTVLQPRVFAELPLEYQHAIVIRARTALRVLDTLYVSFDVPEGVDEGFLRQFKRLYFAEQNLLDKVLALVEETRDPHSMFGNFSNEVSAFVAEGQNAGTIVTGDGFLECLAYAEKNLGPLTEAAFDEPQFPPDGLDSNRTYAFVKAYELCFSCLAHNHTGLRRCHRQSISALLPPPLATVRNMGDPLGKGCDSLTLSSTSVFDSEDG